MLLDRGRCPTLQGRTASEPFLAWVKEGRKYDLGALLVTQQPGSIPVEILSQGDNWFVFHLLASADLVNLQRANAHFSDDILAALLNEPIPGHGAFWSSVGGSPYPVPIRVLSFDALYRVRDPEYTRERVPTFACELRAEFEPTAVGEVRCIDGKLLFPKLPNQPGVYLLTFRPVTGSTIWGVIFSAAQRLDRSMTTMLA